MAPVVKRLYRYPRTRHVEGSTILHDDDDHEVLAWELLRGHELVVEEKIDGANVAVSFTEDGCLVLQSRNRILDPKSMEPGGRDAVYRGLAFWAAQHEDLLWPRLGSRYVLFGEWMRVKQAVFYDALPTAFVEFDVLDKESGAFLSTQRRRALLRGLPIVSAPVLAQGCFEKLSELLLFLGPSRFKTPDWRQGLRNAVITAEVTDPDRLVYEADASDDMEGLYLKREEHGIVIQRAKLVRPLRRADGVAASRHAITRIKNRIHEDIPSEG